MKESNFVSAVVYLRQCRESVVPFLTRLHATLRENFKKFELICVDDASDDGSGQAVRDFAAGVDGAMVSLLRMSYPQGVEASMNAGVDLAIGDFVFEFDSTALDYPAQLVMEVYRTALTGASHPPGAFRLPRISHIAARRLVAGPPLLP